MGKTPPLLMQRREVVFNIWSHAFDFEWVRLSPCYGHERSGLQYLESCTGVWVGKTPPLLTVRREVVFNLWSHVLEFGWVRLPRYYWAGEKGFATSGVMHWSLGG